VAKQNLAPNFECQPDLTMNSYSRRYRQVLTNLFLDSVAHALCLSILAQHDRLAIEAVDPHDSPFYCDAFTRHHPSNGVIRLGERRQIQCGFLSLGVLRFLWLKPRLLQEINPLASLA
jgi:hypothetical protein